MKEIQYEKMKSIIENNGRFQLGLISNAVWNDDPRSLLFKLARYKFVSHLVKDSASVLEVGSGDGFCSRIVAFAVDNLTLSDFDIEFVNELNASKMHSNIKTIVFNPISEQLTTIFDVIYSLDVIEHVNQIDEERFMINLKASLKSDGIMIFGTPSLESQVFASERSKAGHVNCKSADEWKQFFNKHFGIVLQFGMNDEVIHTGFGKMSHYLFYVCVNKK